MKKYIILIIVIFLPNVLFSQTTLSAGDIAIIQYNSAGASGGTEEIKFLALTSMESGTVVNFTDKGWITTGAGSPKFRTSEGIYTWTAPSDVSCGDIITIPIPVVSGGFNLARAGDQIFVFQGTATSPTFIFGINNNGAGVWQTDSTSSNTSGLPTGLINTENAVAIQEVDNVYYSGPLTGSKAAVLSNICDKSNWSSGNNLPFSTNTTTPVTFPAINEFNTTWDGTTWDGTSGDFLNTTIDGSYDTSSDGNFKACNCTVNTSETLTVKSGGTVTVESNITNNGTILVESGGSVVQVLSSGVNTGTDYTVERTTASQSSRHVFTYWSSPITSATFSAVAADAHLYYSFNASSQDWVQGNSSTAMNPGIGYSLEGPDSGASYPGVQTAAFTGAAFNTGDISVTLGNDGTDFWNLVGNPYPSAIDADTFLSDNSGNIGGTIYFWTHNSDEDGTEANTEDDYVSWNGAGGITGCLGCTAPDGKIASGQGFFVEATSTTLNFTNSMRISGDNTSFFKTDKKTENNAKDRIWLNIIKDKSFSQILVGFFADATDGEDRKYDGIRFLSKASLNLYSILNDNYYGIQGKSSLKETEIIPLGFSSNASGEFTISIDKVEGNLENSFVYLQDTYLDVKHNLKEADYVFSALEAIESDTRFKLIIETQVRVLNNEQNDVLTGILIQNKEHSIVVKTTDNTIIKKVWVYNLLGKQIMNKENTSSSLKLHSPSLKSNSVYIIKTILENGKVLVNKIYKN